MKRLFDILLSIISITALLIPMLCIAFLVKIGSKGPVIHWSKRVGMDNETFLMPKFRTMVENTPNVATHLMKDSDSYLTDVGKILRKTSLDELPQLYSIFRGCMSFVGPRPALFNQYDLIELRTKKGIHSLKPGLTGWSQINGRDDLDIKEKVYFDMEYLQKKSFFFDLSIIYRTVIDAIKQIGITH